MDERFKRILIWLALVSLLFFVHQFLMVDDARDETRADESAEVAPLPETETSGAKEPRQDERAQPRKRTARRSESATSTEPVQPARASQLTASFDSFRHKSWVTGVGKVVKVLPDDVTPPCHQRFLIVDARGRSLLIANNIDEWARLRDVRVGELIAFKGEYVSNERGGLVHWTHPDKSGRRQGGWLRRVK